MRNDDRLKVSSILLDDSCGSLTFLYQDISRPCCPYDWDILSFFLFFFVMNCVSPLSGEGIKYVSASLIFSFIGHLCLDIIPHIRHVIRPETTTE